jgi:hypothetical protein
LLLIMHALKLICMIVVVIVVLMSKDLIEYLYFVSYTQYKYKPNDKIEEWLYFPSSSSSNLIITYLFLINSILFG